MSYFPEILISWKSKGLYESKLVQSHGAFLPYIKQFGYKIGIRFNYTSLVAEKYNYTTKIINDYIVCDLDNWPKLHST